MNKLKIPRDMNQLTQLIVDVAIDEADLPKNKPRNKNPAAVALGKLRGLKDGTSQEIL